jgi:hypothetical protein
LVGEGGIVILANKRTDSMEAIDAILNEVDKLQPDEKLKLLHELVDRMLATPALKSSSQTDFDKYVGIGKDVWGQDAQLYINESRTNERF